MLLKNKLFLIILGISLLVVGGIYIYYNKYYNVNIKSPIPVESIY